MADRDIQQLREELQAPGGDPGSERRRGAIEALDRVEQRLAVADRLHDSLATRYALVWPIPGVLMSGRRRKRMIKEYERVSPPAGERARH